MSAGVHSGELDPLIHAPARLRILVTLASLSQGDSLSFPRLQSLLGLTAGNLVTHLRKLEHGEYLTATKSGSCTSVALTVGGRAALQEYTATLQRLLDGVDTGEEVDHD